MYNFDWQEGDSISESDDVVSVDYMTIEGVTRKVLTLGFGDHPDNHYLIEGIGDTNWNSLLFDMYPIPVSTYLGSKLISCHKDGVCLFSREKFFNQINGTDGVSEVARAPSTADDTIYDLNGRPVAKPAKGQIYIIDGKKTVW